MDVNDVIDSALTDHVCHALHMVPLCSGHLKMKTPLVVYMPLCIGTEMLVIKVFRLVKSF